MENEAKNYTNVHQTLLFADCNEQNSHKSRVNSSSKRNCLVQTFLTSSSLLDCDATCKIFAKDLNDYAADSCNLLSEFEQKITNSTTNTKYVPSELKSTLNKSKVSVPFNSSDEKCFKNGYCVESETISDENFKSFMEKVFNNKKNCNTISQQSSSTTSGEDYYEIKTNFTTASEEMRIRNLKKLGNSSNLPPKKTLCIRKCVSSKFVSPIVSKNNSSEDIKKDEEKWLADERLKNIEPRMVELILSEIMETGSSLSWDDIAGLEFAKTTIQEAVIWPMLRPDLFTGLRRPPKGILLFGPPGTGKTLIGKCVASQSQSTFFSISASSLTSKWIGDGEKMVRALFTVARCRQPAVIFIDEIDSLLSQRNETEHESSRRMKTEFLVQLDGATTGNEERLLIIGATNRPQELDEAARRRFVKRLYIPLPEINARQQLVERLISKEKHSLTSNNVCEIAKLTDGYSGADLKTLCSEASMGPIRSLNMSMIQSIRAAEVRPIGMEDFLKAVTTVKSSVSNSDLDQYIEWDKTFGAGF